MQYCMSHPDEMSKLSKLKAQITEVKGIMMDNIEKVSAFFDGEIGRRKCAQTELANIFFIVAKKEEF